MPTTIQKDGKRRTKVNGNSSKPQHKPVLPPPAVTASSDGQDGDESADEDDDSDVVDDEDTSADESDDIDEAGMERLMRLLDDEDIGSLGVEGEDDDEDDDSFSAQDVQMDDNDQDEEEDDSEDIQPPVETDKAIVLRRVHDTFKLRPSFFDNLNLIYPQPLDIPDPENDLQRELQFYKQALWGVVEAESRFQQSSMPFYRPDDFFAEMIKSDAQMAKIRQALLDESASIKASQEARKLRDAKKFGKRVQVEKKKEREREEKAVGKKLDSLKKKRRNREFETAEDFDVALENALETAKDRKKKMPESARRTMSRKTRNNKFGFGPGGSRRSKENNDRKDKPAFAKGRHNSKRTRRH